MNLSDLIARVKSNLRDERGSAFLESDIKSFINESIDRVRQVIPELISMKYLNELTDVPIMLPESYHHLLAVYGSARCFAQDERHYQGSTFMNEFEFKLNNLKNEITNGDLILVDKYGDELEFDLKNEYVFDNYFNKKNFDYGDREEVL